MPVGVVKYALHANVSLMFRPSSYRSVTVLGLNKRFITSYLLFMMRKKHYIKMKVSCSENILYKCTFKFCFNPGLIAPAVSQESLLTQAIRHHSLQLTLLSCMSRLAPFFKSTSVASTLLTAAAQWRADFPKEEEQIHGSTRTIVNNKEAQFLLSENSTYI